MDFLDSQKISYLIENLQLRLSLLGGMFDTVLAQGPVHVSNLLVQLITTGIADIERFRKIWNWYMKSLILKWRGWKGYVGSWDAAKKVPKSCNWWKTFENQFWAIRSKSIWTNVARKTLIVTDFFFSNPFSQLFFSEFYLYIILIY